MAGAVVGAFLGLRPAVRITVMCAAAWLVTWLIVRMLPGESRKRLTPLAALWCATLAHLVFWKPLAGAFSW
jgi:hypothetical protein